MIQVITGQLFILIGTLSHLSQRLPKSGPWMEFIKFIFGTSMFAVALYLLAPIIPDSWFHLSLGLLLLSTALIYKVFTPLTPAFGWTLKHGLKYIFLILFALGLAFTMDGSYQIVSPTQTIKKHQNWVTYTPEAFSEALRQGKPILFDFYADWCASCNELDRNTFSHPQVEKATSQFMLFSFDATKDSAQLRQLQQQFDIKGLPTVLFFTAKGEIVHNLTLTEYEPPEKFLLRIKKVLEN